VAEPTHYRRECAGVSERVRSYRVTGIGQDKGKPPASYKISIPPRMARMLPSEAEFIPEWHEHGILLRRVEAIPEVPLPEWVKAERQL